MKKYFLILPLCLTLSLISCDKEESEDNNTTTENTTNDDGEGAAAAGVLEAYDGTYNVTGDGHNRGTVIISGKGTHIDFDTNIAYDIEDENVYDRIDAFDRYQIEFFDENNNQDRIRINLDANDPSIVVGFDYDAGADEADIISVTVE